MGDGALMWHFYGKVYRKGHFPLDAGDVGQIIWVPPIFFSDTGSMGDAPTCCCLCSTFSFELYVPQFKCMRLVLHMLVQLPVG